MPNFTGTIALSTGGLGKSIIGQFFTAAGAQLNVASVGVPPPVALSTYGNGWSTYPSNVSPEITAANTLQVLNAYTTNANTNVANGVLSASVTLDASNTSFQFYFRTTPNQTSVGLIKFSYATSGSNVLTVTYIENYNYSATVLGTANGPAVAPGTAFTASVTFNGTATTVSINGVASGSFTAVNVTGTTTGECGVGSNQSNPGSVQVGSFLLQTTAGTTVFSDNFPYSLTIAPVTISINGGPAIDLPSPTWAVPQPNFTIPAPYVFWPLPQYDQHVLWYNSALYTNDSRQNLVGLTGGTGGYYGNYGIAPPPTSAQIAASTLQNEGLFPFQGLQPTSWTINATWPALAANSTAVTVKVLSGSSGAGGVTGDGDGSTLATYTINQTIAPAGGPTINGVVFQTLGSVTTSDAPSGLTVVFSNSLNTGQVVFDAVSIAPTSAVSTILKSTDVVTLSCSTVGWASFADGSYAPVMTNAPVSNMVGGYNFPAVNPSTPQTMAIGLNVDGDYSYTAVPFQANFAKRSAIFNADVVLAAYDPVTLYPTIINGVGVAPPSGITLTATAGTGTLPAGTYEYQVVSNNTHGQSPASSVVSITTAGTGEITIAWPAVTGATSYNVYGRVAGGIAQIASQIAGTSFVDNGTITPAGGLPTPPSVQTSPLLQVQQTKADGLTLPIAPLGNYTLMWNGTCNCTLVSGDRSVSEITADAVITGGVNNTRVFNVADIGQISPGFNIEIYGTTGRSDGNWNCDLTNLRLYPPGVNVSNPPYVSPWWAPSVYGSCIRVMQGIGTNSSNIVNFADMLPESCITAYGNYTISAPIVSVGPGDQTRCFFPSPTNYPTNATYPMLVTTATPHGFTTGQVANLNGSVGTLIYDDPTQPGGTQSVNIGNYFGIIDVVDATHFQMINFQYNGGPIQNTLTPTGCTASVSLLTTGMTLAGAVEAANAANADLWYNIHLLANDNNVTQCAQYIAANLAPGKKWYLEYSNETWNGSFQQPNTCIYLGNQLLGSHTGQDYSYYYVLRMGQVQALAMTAWTAAGRSASSLVRVVATQNANTTPTESIAQHMQALNVPADVLAVATYANNQVIGTPSLQPIFDMMSVDQLSEHLDIALLWSPWQTQAHLAAMAQYGFTNIKAVCYEGSFQAYLPNEGATAANAYARSYGVLHHPRTFQHTLYKLFRDQASGVTLFNMFINSGIDVLYGMWPALVGYIPNPGTGSMTADAANLTNPLAFSSTAVKNEAWGAYKHWSTVAPNTSGVIPPGPLKFFFHEGTLHGGFLTLGI